MIHGWLVLNEPGTLPFAKTSGFMPRGVLRISSDQGMIEWEQKSRPKKKPLGLPTKPKKYPCTKH